MSVKKTSFGKTKDGVSVTAYTMDNGCGMSLTFIDLGATVTSIIVPDRNGAAADVVGGYDDPDTYLSGVGYPGAVLGRFGNRISGAKFTLDGVEYRLYANDNVKNHLHGGKIGFDRRMWDVKILNDGDEPKAELSYVSPDGEEGYPGTLGVKVYYSLSKKGEFKIRYTAVTDKKTVLNLTNHSYFNLSGFESDTILDHEVMINSKAYLEADSELIPTGRLIPVDGTPHDFRTPKTVGRDICSDDVQLKYGKGYDHCFVLEGDGEIRLAARVRDPKSGRVMEVYTNQPAVQLYTGNCLEETEPPYKGGVRKRKNAALCLETEHYPDSPNHPEFPSTVLEPGQTYDYTTVFAFSAQ